jgi:ATP-dependent helicase/nuclease subunit A
LLEWKQRFREFHPYRIPAELRTPSGPAFVEGDADTRHLTPIVSALGILKDLHRRRNYIPVAETIQQLLSATRAHVALVLRSGGEQALANVLHVAELARQYEASGGTSFRGFVDELRIASEGAQAAEAPILEEGSDGVRIMTVHKAKGLEFPVVVLADLTCKLSRAEAGRWIDSEHGLCALKIGGWAPIDLLLHDAEEAARDKAESERLTYVAATRARDLLVVPVVGDGAYDGGWLDPLMPAVYPSLFGRQTLALGPGCPAFPSRDSVLIRPDGDPAKPTTVAPGLYSFGGQEREQSDPYSVVWWDPHVLSLDRDSGYGLRRDDLIAKDGDPLKVAARLAEYHQWRIDRDKAVARARVPSVRVRTATSVALDRTFDNASGAPEIEVIDFSRSAERPFGPRFGTLVHATLATVPLDASQQAIAAVAHTQSRILPTAGREPYTEEEVSAAVEVVSSLLRDPLFDRVRQAERAGRCDRELPIVWKAPDGTLVEGTIDLAFEDLMG